MHRLRNRLIIAFLAATVLPLAATIWITTSLLERSLDYADTEEMDGLSRSLETTVRELYQRDREALNTEVASGRIEPKIHDLKDLSAWPDAVRDFWNSGEREGFGFSGPGGDHLDYLVRDEAAVRVYSRSLGAVRMEELTQQLRVVRQRINVGETRNLERGFTLTLILLVSAVWLIALVWLIFLAHRISRPIHELTAGLAGFASGNWNRRLEKTRDDEVGQAVDAFNHMTAQLRRSRERLVYLTRVASWQGLARKTAHELKNSLTPIRLTVEEMLDRQPNADQEFMRQAGSIVVSEIDTLERRVRAFSEFSSEPVEEPRILDLNELLEDRIALLRPAHPEVEFRAQLAKTPPRAFAGPDQIKGILTNLLQNAAEAAGSGGRVTGFTTTMGQEAVIEVHDTGPGLDEETRRTLFEPTISFKKNGMGLGLSIARKNALLSGGDIVPIQGRLGGAGFRLILPLGSGAVE